jgi:hypothetical protein
LSWRERYDAGHAIDVPCIDFGAAQIVLMPAEALRYGARRSEPAEAGDALPLWRQL